MPRKLRGFTLTEAAIVLGIVGLILGAIWVAAAAVYNNMRVSTANTQLLQMVSGIRSLYATQQAIEAGVSAGGLSSTGAIPRDMIDPNVVPPALPAVRHVWNDDVDIAQASNVFAGDSFTVTFNTVPRQACTELVVRTTGGNRDTGLTDITVNGTAVALPSNVSLANAACNAATNDIVWTFNLRT